MIKVETLDENKFRVTIKENSDQSEHTVTLDEDTYQRLTREKVSKKDLIRLSFEFLLNREPSESIFSQFNLNVIQKYFPDYENEIRKMTDAK